MIYSRTLLGLGSGLATCGDKNRIHMDGGCLFSSNHHLTYAMMFSQRTRYVQMFIEYIQKVNDV